MSCQTMTARKNDNDGRCESIFVHVETVILVSHWHIDFSKNVNSQCGNGAKKKTLESDDKQQNRHVRQRWR